MEVLVSIDTLHKLWNIKPENIHGHEFTGYELLYAEFDRFTKEVYEADPEGTIDEVLKLYRTVNLTPIVYYTEQGIVEAITKFRDTSYNNVDVDRIGLGNNKGQTINRFLFPNMMTAEPKGRKNNSLKDRFLDDPKMRRAIKICFEMREGSKLVYPTALRRSLELVTGENIQNFKPLNAKAIVEHICPQLWGRVYDYSCGYGGRLLGITSSNLRYDYVGVDPNTETVDNLRYLDELIQATGGPASEIHQSVSEEFVPENIDCAFSSPPYFNLEKYSDEPTQCMNRYSTMDEWFEGYVVPTMQNIHTGLNKDGVFATNIADYKSYGNKEYFVVDRWIETAEKLGFKHTETIKMMLNTRPGVGNNKLEGREKFEGVYVFTKTS
jgi:SAM-dependent methyltransferase